MKKKALSLLVAVLVLCGLTLLWCIHHHHASASTQLKARFYLNWIYTGSFAGEVVGVQDFASQNGIEIQIEPGAQGMDPLKLVGDGDFGIAAADEILGANDKGADFVIIGVVNDDSPTVFLSLKGSGITTPQDFVGRRVGILPFGSTGLVYQALLKKLNIDRRKITEVVVSSDLRPFLTAHTNDVQPAFAYDETVTLDDEQIAYNTIIPSQYGVTFKGPCYFTRRSTIEKYPTLVYGFVKTMAEGWAAAIANPNHAIDALKKADLHIDEHRELQVLQRGIPYYASATRRPLESDPNSWAPMIDNLASFGVLSSKPEVSSFLDLSFVHRYYAEARQ